MMGAVLALSGIEGVELAFHGPSGCYTIAGHVRTDQAPMGVYFSMRPSGVTEDNLVMGTSMEKLSQLVKFMKMTFQKERSRLFAIVNTDSTAITGDDILGTARRFEKDTGFPAIAVDAPGFKGWDVVGYDLSYRALLGKFAPSDSLAKVPDSVNIIAPYMLPSQNWIFDFEEIKSLLARLGIRINCVLTRNTRIEDIKNFSAAQWNLQLSAEDFPSFQKETDRLGVPSFGADLPLPYGVANTEAGYLGVARRFGKEDKARDIFAEDSKRVKSILGFNYTYTWLANLLMQKRVAVIGREKFAASIARMLFYDLDAYPDMVILQGSGRPAFERSKALLADIEKDGYPVKIMENPSYIEVARLIQESEVDFVIGSRIEKPLIEGTRIPHLSLGSAGYFQSFRFVPYPYVGYNGSLYLLQELGHVMHDMMTEKEMWRGLRFKNM